MKGLGARVEPKGRYTKEPQERKHTSGFNVNKQVERCDYRMGWHSSTSAPNELSSEIRGRTMGKTKSRCSGLFGLYIIYQVSIKIIH